MRRGFLTLFLSILLAGFASAAKPNVLWIYVDDMSDWLGCYGHSAVPTPHIDALAAEGVRFERAYMPSPVCSTTRSALITGQMQTSLGLHDHRTMLKKPLPAGAQTIPELFQKAGYLTFNEAKEDYNFTIDRAVMYSPDFGRPGFRSHLVGRDVSWLKQLQGRPFFGQIQLKGGKFGGETGSKFLAESRVDAASVTVPPYYPNDEVMRNAIARHYEQIAETDEQVGAIVAALKEYGLWENTFVVFFTDHGCPLPRAKQFLYEDGTKVPLIVRGPGLKKGSTRSDLVSGIDITSSSLAVAGLTVPDNYEGIDLFATKPEPRTHVVSARDRCGIAVDRIRAVRTERYRYLRNYQTDRALFQSQYRDRYATFTRLQSLYDDGKLNSLQATYFDSSQRSAEELYDLVNDPHQTTNLANHPDHAAELARHRALLADWETRTGDRGRTPASKAELRAVYEGAKGKAPAPEFDFLR